MKIKVGDSVLVLSGEEKGKVGHVIKTIKSKQKLIIENVNIVKKHQKPNNANENGGIIEIEAPIHVSNVKKIDEKEYKKIMDENKKETKVTEKVAKETKTVKQPKEKKAK